MCGEWGRREEQSGAEDRLNPQSNLPHITSPLAAPPGKGATDKGFMVVSNQPPLFTATPGKGVGAGLSTQRYNYMYQEDQLRN